MGLQEVLITKGDGDLEKAKKAWNDRNSTLRVSINEDYKNKILDVYR